MEDAEPIAFILARGLSKEDIQEAREMVARVVPGLPIGNVSIIGTSWRPWRGYQNETKHENQVALRSEQIEP
jgi:flagellar biosynthesis/type III secretory pathway M-ring protein FliF/YscJ